MLLRPKCGLLIELDNICPYLGDHASGSIDQKFEGCILLYEQFTIQPFHDCDPENTQPTLTKMPYADSVGGYSTSRADLLHCHGQNWEIIITQSFQYVYREKTRSSRRTLFHKKVPPSVIA
jgi:hypothetical protein